MTILSEVKLEKIRRRRSAGESVGELAREVGVSWQRLWSLMYQVERGRGRPIVRAMVGAGPLVERYRPLSLDAIWGQENVVKILRHFLEKPYPTSFLFEGDTGTGKTSAAMALAAELGCDLSQKPSEFGGLHIIASGEQTADAVREVYELLFRYPFSGSGWKVAIVNEADRMHAAAETVWLDRLEQLPPKTVFIFTTNMPEKLSARFRDRCMRLEFESDSEKLSRSARKLLAAIWKKETGKSVDPSSFSGLVDKATVGGKLSFRRALQLLSEELFKIEVGKDG